MTPRSWLFVPADKPEMITKALAAGADAVIVDLEDSVLPQNKPGARQVVARLPKATGPQLWIRINALHASLHADETQLDLDAAMQAEPAGIVLPKAESAAAVIELSHHLDELEAALGRVHGSTRVLPLVTETPKSLFQLGSYTEGLERLAGLTWGAEDLSAAVGAVTPRDEEGALTSLYELARALCIAAAAAAGVAAIDTVYPAFRDLTGLRSYAERGRRDGFQGMLAIHPSQVPIINEVFTPSAAEVAYAQRVVETFKANPTQGAVPLDGKMLDAPHLKQARRIMERHERWKG